MKLIIGNKNYSGWSLRPWLLLRHADIPFEEIRILVYTPDSKQSIIKYSPSGKVPALVDGDVTAWDSLAICEYLAEKHPDKKFWPDDRVARALARAVGAEMHSGFQNLRENMPMNIRRDYAGLGCTPEVERDIARITEIWQGCRKAFGSSGPFLFGAFSIADAMFAPVMFRFRTYGVMLPEALEAYKQTM